MTVQLCYVCKLRLDPALVQAGYGSHVVCDPAEVSPMWAPGDTPVETERPQIAPRQDDAIYVPGTGRVRRVTNVKTNGLLLQ